MITRIIKLVGLPTIALGKPNPACTAVVLKADYVPCANKAVKQRGNWQLCAPHSRLEEIEVVDKTT